MYYPWLIVFVVLVAERILRSMLRWFVRGLAVVGAVPMVLFASRSLIAELPNFSDPCFKWGPAPQVMVLEPGSPCELGMRGTSDTKTRAIVRLSLVQGTMLVASAVGVAGAFTRRGWLAVAAVAMLAVLSIPLMVSGLGPRTLACAACFLPAALLGGNKTEARSL